MGLKINRPRRGSMGVYPRKRAADIVPRVRTWPEVNLGKPTLLGFAAYKAGMLHAVVVDDRPTSPLYGKEVVKAVTVLDAPPLYVAAVRLYTLDPTNGYKVAVGEAWVSEPPADLRRVLTLPEKFDTEKQLKALEEYRDVAVDVRVLVATQPRLSGIGKKTPEVLEIPVGGVPSIDERINFAISLLGKTVSPKDVFTPGQLVDVIAVTKGKGYQGVVKRFGVTILPRWHKHRKGHRRTGTIGPQAPALMFTQPRPGQMGFHQRTEYNKRILKIGDNGAEITPKSGFPHYGVIKGPYILLQGSVPGARKRLVVLRYPVRPPKKAPPAAEPQVVWVSSQSI
ncbi:50S ribosomal protein L3 [Pyrobaculum calidifontis]|uniref:Large ribosomal subunit protein uL3 n=1 Tax=Pyrobaculum calidifontis (strain DSM 21063 / JCM 11548 / VA1) TaxID=410359 RepID=RL3_PYRCJ|nr:50S ribosomal protein L3 [Pyrobaculum calidifontis]A3MWI4.1 RecName: Full=Large ribosomal subunit protein uL3; AltName: Full=50S ribosomal protein L3 [Pyrobaculum calidifontis JCM 11548]ABO09001.1 LSU ribosomal protein L3P [Pyrobaculum calidifontis JCM 11548]